MIILDFILWLLWAFIMMGVSENLIHKYLMHKRFFRNEKLNWIWYNHAVLHHKKDDNSHNIDLSIWNHLIIGSPLLITLFFLSPIGLSAVLLVFLHHSYIWTHAHRAIHGLEKNWLQKTKLYNKMYEHHIRHHYHTNRNFGVVHLWTDKLFRTKI